jgi:copper(I)-binding protein
MKGFFIAFTLALFFSSAFAMNDGHTLPEIPSHMNTNSTKSNAENGLKFTNFRTRASIGNSPNSAAYGIIAIKSGSDRLIKVSSSKANAVELHEHLNDNGVMRMRRVKGGLQVNQETPLIFQPGGYHIMLLGLKEAIRPHTEVDLSLEFTSGKIMKLTIPVVPITEMHH